MKATVFWVEIVCRDCAAAGHGEFVRGKIPIKALKVEAQKDGWSITTAGDWRCPRCTAMFFNDARTLAGYRP